MDLLPTINKAYELITHEKCHKSIIRDHEEYIKLVALADWW